MSTTFNYLNVNSEPFIMANTLTNLSHQGYLDRYGSSLLFGVFLKYSSINSKLSELQMKAKILPFIQRQGMCPGTPMGPSAAETLPQPPPCLHQALPTQFPRQQWSLAMDAQGRQQGSHNIFMSVCDFPLFEKESQVCK